MNPKCTNEQVSEVQQQKWKRTPRLILSAGSALTSPTHTQLLLLLHPPLLSPSFSSALHLAFGVSCAVSCFLQLALSSHFIQQNSGCNNLTAFVACWYYSSLINCAPGRATGEPRRSSLSRPMTSDPLLCFIDRRQQPLKTPVGLLGDDFIVPCYLWELLTDGPKGSCRFFGVCFTETWRCSDSLS